MVFYSKGVMKVSNILIQESWIDKKQGLLSGDTEVYETYLMYLNRKSINGAMLAG